MKKRSTARWL